MGIEKEYSVLEKISSTVNSFKGISLEEMNTVSLMKRTDTKYIININYLVEILDDLKEDYQVLEIEDRRIMNYSSVYFDTSEFKFYFDHHNGRVKRTKIRQRKYVDSGLTFLEIKQKNGKGETHKSRIKIPDFDLELSENLNDFIFKTTNTKFYLQPSLWNSFNRITLVNLKDNERATIDLKLSYYMNDIEKSYNNLVVIEVKQGKFDRKSVIVKTLKKYRYNPYSISKYCIGMVNLYKELKYNLFKQKLIKINKISA
ncbi:MULTISPECIES: polyphosphate polymerase domain-containing protein [unclassified Polaribacter]|uniref:polyphosphate polymerase domain-containing protein n=1 Tax=unclassified Polaribacter TaxID=196858 RepID=UPI0011BFB8A0|nr:MULTISPECIES: polyphosphate polymerase domain-containing protein [unclassified Polaribacter]TXD52693.1 polyphosphate polymerase domain-containing protein [Polaribacter sp. IC063]TXD60661.1 polyphosphate polymerase domain-containing protein [Polaribacter sp. IC066]